MLLNASCEDVYGVYDFYNGGVIMPTFIIWLYRQLEDDKSVRVDMLSFLVYMASMCQQNADNFKGVMAFFQGFLYIFSNCLLEKVKLGLKSAKS